MSGLGTRFYNSEFEKPKPFIEVNGKEMYLRSAHNCHGDRFVFVVQKENSVRFNMHTKVFSEFESSVIIELDSVTSGPAVSALKAAEWIDNENELLIINSDQELLWNYDDFISEARKSDGCVVVVEREGDRWSFAKEVDGIVTMIAEKNQISKNALCGIHYFKRGSDFIKYAKQMLEDDNKVNNEFYVSNVYNYAIEDGKIITMYKADDMLDYGTPESLRVYL
jgi:dTDP-glucose pyrophosphorylase